MAVPINYLAVLLCGIVSMVLGFVWYGALFGKTWVRLSGMNPNELTEAKKRGMMVGYLLSFVGSLVMADVLAHVLIFSSAYMNVSGLYAGLAAGFWSWLG